MSYGQNPYGQNPYGGQPPQQPYGQRPYGGQQPNPYGPPPQQGEPNPYGQPPGQPGPPQPGQPSPYGQPQQNPYGQPQQNPYGRPQQPGQPNPYGHPQQGQPGQQNPYGQQPGQGQRPQSAPSAGGLEGWQAAQPPAAPEALATSTPLTIASHAVPVHTLEDDPESFIDRTLGEVIGVALRPQAKDPASLTKARQDAVSRMAEMAKAADADAVVGLRFDSNSDEIVAYGTAVIFSDELELAAYATADDEVVDTASSGTRDLSAAAATAGQSGNNGHTDFSGSLGSDEGETAGARRPTESGPGEETPFADEQEEPDQTDVTRMSTSVQPEPPAPTDSTDSAALFGSPAPAPAAADSESTWNPASGYTAPYGQSNNPYAQGANPYAQPGQPAQRPESGPFAQGGPSQESAGQESSGQASPGQESSGQESSRPDPSGQDDQSNRPSQGWPFSGS